MKNLRQLLAFKPGEREQLLSLSDERDMWLRRLDASWREGFFFGAMSCADDYDQGFADGIAAYKAAERDHVQETREYLERWQGLRKDFGKPRPGDFQGKAGRS